MKKRKRILVIVIVIALLLLTVHIVCGAVWKNLIKNEPRLALPEGGEFVHYRHFFWDRWECVIAWDDPLVYDQLIWQITIKDFDFTICPLSDTGYALLERYPPSDPVILDKAEFAPSIIRRLTENFGGVLCRTDTQTLLYLKNPFPYLT